MNNSNNFTDINAFITWVESQRRFSKKTSLDKMRFLMELLSIHITGTNGKGSSVAMLRSIYQTAGYHVATFTSPYVVCFNERICFDGKYISDLDLLYYGNLIVSKYDLIINTIPVCKINYKKLKYKQIYDLAQTVEGKDYQSLRNIPNLYFPYESALLMFQYIHGVMRHV